MTYMPGVFSKCEPGAKSARDGRFETGRPGCRAGAAQRCSCRGGGARRRLLSSATALQKHNGSNGGGNPELLLNVTGRSALAESYRQLRTSVLLSTAGRAPKTLLITSSLPGEGKTTTAVNTAISLAQTGAAVVIIDADMRRPRLRSIFDLPERQGLSSILSSEMKAEEMLSLIALDETTGLHDPSTYCSTEMAEKSRRIPAGDPSHCCLLVDAELSSDVGHMAPFEERQQSPSPLG